ncbi:hypothetical protein LCGC14_0792060 [marine sediment metagenome]|uniref:Uncharacterized protein n=1 Tax=marine sediment metagenome TaxID=412755 RepID=A0A0F9SC84_9ZZZZ
MKLETVKDLERCYDCRCIDEKCVIHYLLKKEAIKWVKEDLEYLKIAPKDDATQIAINIIIKVWMHRLNITKGDLK